MMANSLIWFVGLFGLVVACSGPQYVTEECRDEYDECINVCAYECEDTPLITGPASLDEENQTFDNWDSACDLCVNRCGEAAERCAERNADE